MTKLPEGFIELHLKSGNPILVKVDMIGFMSPVLEVGTYDKKKVNWTHITSLAHNNGGFDVTESYKKVIQLMTEAAA